MRILYFHQHFSTPDGSAGTRSFELAKAALRAGHSVTMVCGSYDQGQTGLSVPFKKGVRRGITAGIDVIEFNLGYSNKLNFYQRLWIFLRYLINCIPLVFKEPADVVFCTTTPLTAGIPGITARLFTNKKFVFEVRDLWPELPRAMKIVRNPILLTLMRILELCSYRAANHLIGLSPGIVDGITATGINTDKVKLIPNGCDLGLFGDKNSSWRPEGICDDQLLAVYSGTHGVANGLEAILDAAAILKKRHRDDIHILFVGAGKEKPALISRAKREQLQNVSFIEPLKKKELSGLLAGADVGLQCLLNLPAFYYGTSPNKFFDYIASGLPVLNNYPGWVAGLISEFDCGYVVPPDDPYALTEALIDAADNRCKLIEKGVRARKLAKQKFDRTKLSDEWVNWVLKS